MANPFGVPSVTVKDVEQKRAAGEEFILLDVREPSELEKASLSDVETAPTSKLSYLGPEALPESVRENKDAEIVVMCRTGGRSAQVTAWLRSQGWSNVWNMDGGIHAWSREIDPTLPRY
jgi:adenylyltransferase/sulfurtransferase